MTSCSRRRNGTNRWRSTGGRQRVFRWHAEAELLAATTLVVEPAEEQVAGINEEEMEELEQAVMAEQRKRIWAEANEEAMVEARWKRGGNSREAKRNWRSRTGRGRRPCSAVCA